MNGLSGARVLLLDDEPKEALPVLKAFAKVGVPVAYFDGKLNGLPTNANRLRGVRLTILDMNLGVSGPDTTIASTLVQTFSRILSKDNGPYGVLVWTNHPELKDIVAKYIYEHPDLPNPVFVVQMKKADFLRGVGENAEERVSLSALSSRIRAELEDSSPLECMQAWEGDSFIASSNVTNSIVEVDATGVQDLSAWKKAWCDQAATLLLVISQARSEKHHDPIRVLDSAFLSLNPLHSDRMDVLAEATARKVSRHAAKVSSAQGASSPQRRARVNSMLHLGSDHLDEFKPGNMYLFGKSKVPDFMPKWSAVIDGCVNGKNEILTANSTLVKNKGRLCAIEISPVCDHAQKKMGFAKLLTGFVVPVEDIELRGKIKENMQFARRIGPVLVKINSTVQVSYIYLNSKYVANITTDLAKTMKPVCRVRSELLADLQFWASYQGARQGVMMLA